MSDHNRNKSSIINMRNFHNWIKNNLIKEAVEYLNENYDIKSPSLFDLSSGKGGDMWKWYNNGIYDIVGIDIDENSITEANKRYHELKNKLNNHKKFNYKFYMFDLSNPDNIFYIDKLIEHKKFNIISCQFAIHYFFKNEESLNTLLTIVENYIDKNGIFIGTTMDGEKITEGFMKDDNISNNIFTIENKTNILDTYTPYGNEYKVSVKSDEKDRHYFTDKPSIEYMVDFNELKNMCNKHNLKFIGITEFSKWYDIYIKTSKYKLSDDEKMFSFLNSSFVFMRT